MQSPFNRSVAEKQKTMLKFISQMTKFSDIYKLFIRNIKAEHCLYYILDFFIFSINFTQMRIVQMRHEVFKNIIKFQSFFVNRHKQPKRSQVRWFHVSAVCLQVWDLDKHVSVQLRKGELSYNGELVVFRIPTIDLRDKLLSRSYRISIRCLIVLSQRFDTARGAMEAG